MGRSPSSVRFFGVAGLIFLCVILFTSITTMSTTLAVNRVQDAPQVVDCDHLKTTSAPTRRMRTSSPTPGTIANFEDGFAGGGMNPSEQALLANLYGNATSVFEWGMGSSTLIAEHVGIKRLTAVDSAKVWVKKVSELITRSGYKFVHADIGHVRRYGRPSDPSKRLLWPSYSTQVLSAGDPYDLYLVDGRFRVACACRALLHGRNDSRVIIHDFGHRRAYNVLLTLAEIVEKVDRLVVLRRTADAEAIEKVWEENKFQQE